VVFIAGAWTKAQQEESRWWGASVGALGAAAIVALFALVNITEIVLTAKAAQAHFVVAASVSLLRRRQIS
jgi:hypothetical protein